MRHLRHTYAALLIVIISMTAVMHVSAQRTITPVNNQHTATQPVNEFSGDTARINARIRATMKHYHDADGNIIYVDTVTGREWRDSTAIIKSRIPMQYPLLESVSVGIDLWNPIMRVFGQHYGLIDFSGQISLHNRYKPTVEMGLGIADNTPPDNNFTYRSPLSAYLRIGADYNFLYNSTTDYQYFVGLRYGCSKFSFSLDDITINSNYWDEKADPVIPSQRPFVGWFEFVMGLRVQLWGPISAGWTFRYHSILHESKCRYGNPWYMPGYGTRGTAISGSITISYTLGLNKKDVVAVNPTDPDILIPAPETDDPYEQGITDSTSQADQAAPGGISVE